MVLDDVADDAEAVEVAAAAARAEIFLEGELDRLDVPRVPRRLEELVGPAQRRDVEDHLLAEVVVEAEELRLVEMGGRELVEVVECLRVAAEGLLDHQARVAALAARQCAESIAVTAPKTVGGTERKKRRLPGLPSPRTRSARVIVVEAHVGLIGSS